MIALALALATLTSPPDIDRSAQNCAIHAAPAAAAITITSPAGTAIQLPAGSRWVISPADIGSLTWDGQTVTVDMTCTPLQPVTWATISAEAAPTAGLIPPADTGTSMSQPAPILVESDPTPIHPQLEQVTTPTAPASVDVQPEPDQAGAGDPQPAPATVDQVVLIEATSTIPTSTITIPAATPTTAPWAGEAGNAGPTPIVEQRTLDALWAIGAAAAAAVLGVGGLHCRRAAQA